MEKIHKYAIIQRVFRENVRTDEEGWVDLAVLGYALKQGGLRYVKLETLFLNFQSILEMKRDEEVFPPKVFARMKNVNNA